MILILIKLFNISNIIKLILLIQIIYIYIYIYIYKWFKKTIYYLIAIYEIKYHVRYFLLKHIYVTIS